MAGQNPRIFVIAYTETACFLNNTTDTLLNVFLAIAVDNLANAQILTEDEENEKLERQRKREENKQKYSQRPQKEKGWGRVGAKLPVVVAISEFVRRNRNGHASTTPADPNNVWLVCFYNFFVFFCDYCVIGQVTYTIDLLMFLDSIEVILDYINF